MREREREREQRERESEGEIEREVERERENWEREGGVGSRKMTQIRKFLDADYIKCKWFWWPKKNGIADSIGCVCAGQLWKLLFFSFSFFSSCTPDPFLENCVKFCHLTAQSYVLFWAQKENLRGHVHDNLQNQNNLTEWERARMRERERGNLERWGGERGRKMAQIRRFLMQTPLDVTDDLKWMVSLRTLDVFVQEWYAAKLCGVTAQDHGHAHAFHDPVLAKHSCPGMHCVLPNGTGVPLNLCC